jgi:Mn-dependent DtxR family transcriptional regulator
VIEKSVGLADNLTVETQESTKKEPALDAKVEEQFFDRLYRSFDYKSSNPQQGKQNAKKYGDMTYRDVIDMINTKGGIK